MNGRMYMHPQRDGWVAPQYPEPFVRDRFPLDERVKHVLLRSVRRTAASYSYWTRESLR